MKKILSMLFLILMSCVVRADFDSALKKYQDKQFEEAGAEFMTLAEKGDRDAQFNLGVMYLRGEFYKKDPVEAYAWIALSANGRGQDTIKIRDLIYSKLSIEEKKKADSQFSLYSERYSFQVASSSIEPELVDKFLISPVRAEKKVAPIYGDHRRENIFDIYFMISNDGRVKHIQSASLKNANIDAAIFALKQFVFPYADEKDHHIFNPYLYQRFSFLLKDRGRKSKNKDDNGMILSAKKINR